MVIDHDAKPDRWKRYIPDNYIRRAVYIEQYGVASKVDWSLDGLVGTDLDAVDHYPARLIEDDEGRLVSRHACLQVGLRQSLDMTDACIVGGAFACPGRGATEPDGAVDIPAGLGCLAWPGPTPTTVASTNKKIPTQRRWAASISSLKLPAPISSPASRPLQPANNPKDCSAILANRRCRRSVKVPPGRADEKRLPEDIIELAAPVWALWLSHSHGTAQPIRLARELQAGRAHLEARRVAAPDTKERH